MPQRLDFSNLINQMRIDDLQSKEDEAQKLIEQFRKGGMSAQRAGSSAYNMSRDPRAMAEGDLGADAGQNMGGYQGGPLPKMSDFSPGSRLGGTESGAAFYQAQQSADKQQGVEQLIDQLKIKYNLDDNFTADLMQGLGRIGETDRALSLAERLPKEMAEAQKIGAEAQDAQAKVDKAARDSKYDAAKFEMDVRKEIKADPVVKSFVTINQNWRGIDTVWGDYVALPPEKRDKQSKIAIDQALVNLFNKITDPASVVRESEFARTEQGQAVLERAKGWLPKLRQGGTGLTDKERQEVVNTAGLLYRVAATEFENTKKGYGDAIKPYETLGVSVDNIFAPILSTGEIKVPNLNSAAPSGRDYGSEYDF